MPTPETIDRMDIEYWKPFSMPLGDNSFNSILHLVLSMVVAVMLEKIRKDLDKVNTVRLEFCHSCNDLICKHFGNIKYK